MDKLVGSGCAVPNREQNAPPDVSSSERAPTLIQSLRRGLRLLEEVSRRGQMTARELSRATGIALPTAHHLLRTLVHEGYLDRAGGGTYVVGSQCRSAADLERPVRNLPAVRAELAHLGTVTGTSICLAVLNGSVVRVVHLQQNPKVPRMDWWPGLALPAHATAAGKCILAQLAPRERAAVVGPGPLESLTARTTTDPVRLNDHLRGLGVFHSLQEEGYGIGSTAVPVDLGGETAAVAALYPARGPRCPQLLEDLLRSSAARLAALGCRS